MLFLSYLWFKDDTPFNTWVCLPNSCPTISSVLPPNIPTLSPCFIYIFKRKNHKSRGFSNRRIRICTYQNRDRTPCLWFKLLQAMNCLLCQFLKPPPRLGWGMGSHGALEVAQLIYLFWDHRIPAGRPKIPWKKNQPHVATVNILYHTWDPMDKVYIQIFIPWWSLVNFDHHRSASNYWSLQKKTCGELNETWSQQNDSQ